MKDAPNIAQVSDIIDIIIENTSTTDTVTVELFDVNNQSAITPGFVPFVQAGSVIDTTTPIGAGPSLPNSLVTSIVKDITNNIIYAATLFSGIWVYDITNNTSKIFNTVGGAGFGQQLPSNTVNELVLDTTNNVLYAACSNNGLWQYTVGTDTGKVFNTVGGAGFGQQLPNNRCRDVSIDLTRSILYVATQGGVWQYDIGTDTGTVYNTVGGAGSGAQLPVNDTEGVFIDTDLNTLYAGTKGGGLWQYDKNADFGKVFSTAGGAGNGQQIQGDNIIRIAKHTATNTIYVSIETTFIGEITGVWRYNITTDTGYQYTSTTGVTSGEELPDNNAQKIQIDQTYNLVYVTVPSAGAGIWKLDIANNSGFVFNTTKGADSGNQLPSFNTLGIYLDQTSNILYTGGFGAPAFIWIDTITGGNVSNVVTISQSIGRTNYSEIVKSLLSNPIKINRLRLTVLNGNDTQLSQAFSMVNESIGGSTKQIPVVLSQFISARDHLKIIDIDFNKLQDVEPIIFDAYNSSLYNIEPSTTVNFQFFFNEAVNYSALIGSDDIIQDVEPITEYLPQPEQQPVKKKEKAGVFGGCCCYI